MTMTVVGDGQEFRSSSTSDDAGDEDERRLDPRTVASINLRRLSGNDAEDQGKASMEKDGTYIHTVGVQNAESSKVLVRPFDDSTALRSVDFSDFSNPQRIKELCIRSVPQWGKLTKDDLDINQITEGLTNQLFKVSQKVVTEEGPSIKIVLFRIYGKDIENFFDPAVEVQVFEMLSAYRIAPALYGKGEGWRIEEWHFAVAVPTRLLPNASIYCQVASHLGRFHRLCKRPDFPRNKYDETPSVLQWLDRWITKALKIQFAEDDKQQKALQKLRLDKMRNEGLWLKDVIATKAEEAQQKGEGYDIVFCHNDCQENNLLQTQYGLRLIDFEYAHFNFQAYDISNFFNEWTIDYISNAYPYFNVDLKRYPNEEIQRLFCTVYLSEYLETPVSIGDAYIIEPLLSSIRVFSMASHILWGFWSVMRAPQTQAFDEFDFLEHAKFRFDSYFRTRKIYEIDERQAAPADPFPHQSKIWKGEVPASPTLRRRREDFKDKEAVPKSEPPDQSPSVVTQMAAGQVTEFTIVKIVVVVLLFNFLQTCIQQLASR